MRVENRKQLAARHSQQKVYRDRPTNKRKKHEYDQRRYAAGLVKPSTWHKRHPIKAHRAQKNWFLKKTYGISLIDYNLMLDSQLRKCGVCGVKHTSKRPLHVDHCHKTKRVRGLLCFKCNTALGKLGDGIDLVRNLVRYLAIFNRRVGREVYCV